MKDTTKPTGWLTIGCVFGLGLIINAHAQLAFYGVKATEERAIRLEWQSESNALYQIQFTTELSDTMTWSTLLDNYPSHGTNTFWLDTGEYSQVPAVNHPKYDVTRFYRAVFLGTNLVAPPTISIVAPTNGAALSGQATVTVTMSSSALPNMKATLWVDGQAMDSSDDGTNFVINTCEWANGEHTLFATVKGQSTLSGPSGSYPIDVGHAASAYVPVTFENLITKVAFSESFFEPSLGQTQQVTAAFAANVDWTLEIIDEESNTVRTVTGSGVSLEYDWDGTGDGGTNIADGVYYYVITAQTNGQAFSGGSGGGSGGGNGSPPSPKNFALESNDWYPTSTEEAMMAGLTSYFLPPPPFPPVVIEGKWFKWEEVFGPQPLIEVEIPLQTQEQFLAALEGFEPTESGSGGGVAAYGGAASQGTTAPTRPPSAPSDANQSFQTYFPSDNSADASAPWIRMSELGFGGSLRWMGFLACNNLRDQNYTSMLNQGSLPIGNNLHLLCGTASISYMSENFGELWAKFMLGGLLVTQRTIPNAWFDAGTKAYEAATNITGNVTFRVVGHNNCFNDKLSNYAGSTSGTISYVDQQVYP